MSRRFECLSSALVCALSCSSAIVAQNTDVGETGGMADESGAPRIKAGATKPQYRYRAGAVVQVTTNPDQTQTERIVPAAELKDLRSRNLLPRIHAAHLFAATASIRPRQLAPGETGTLHVLVTLAADTVVLPTSKISLRVFGDTLPVTLGASRVVPARNGTLPGHFHGLPVYDNIVEIRTPVTIESGAAARKYPISGHVEIEVHNGMTGQRVGEFYCGIDGWLRVGRSLATAAKAAPPPRGHAHSSRADDRRESSSSPSSRDIMSGDDNAGVPGPCPRLRRPGSEAKSTQDSNPNDGRAAATGAPTPTGSSQLLFGLGSVVVLGLIFVLLGRRRAV